MQIILAKPRGFCAGVTRAIAIVERALQVYGAPVYVRHEIVHNKTVVAALKNKGARFVDNVNEVPDGSILVFSAHGVPKAIEEIVKNRPIRLFDATCPLVKKVHREVIKMHADGKHVFIIGHAGHPEVEGTMGQIDSGIEVISSVDDVQALDKDIQNTAYVTQTTISVDDAREMVASLKKRFPDIVSPKKDDVCYATQHRQDAIKALAKYVDLVLVIGSTSSSNSNRLREACERDGVPSFLVEDASQIRSDWLDEKKRIGITAGASAPEYLVEGVVKALKQFDPTLTVSTMQGEEENVLFPMPKGLWQSDIEEATR